MIYFCILGTSRYTTRKIKTLQKSHNLPCRGLHTTVVCLRYSGGSKDDGTIDGPDKNPPPTPPGKGAGGSGDKGGGKKGQLRCPKCGDPCTHVETFVCKYIDL